MQDFFTDKAYPVSILDNWLDDAESLLVISALALPEMASKNWRI